MTYYIILSMSCVISSCCTLYVFKKNNIPLKIIINYILALILSILFAIILVQIKTLLISAIKNSVIKINFSMYYTILFLLPSCLIVQKIFECKLNLNLIVNSLLLLIGLSRFACIVNGCCGGLLQIIEIAFATTLLVLNIKIKKITFLKLIFYYSVFRFIFEFFKPTYGLETIFAVSLFQLVLIAVSVTIIIFWRKKTT